MGLGPPCEDLDVGGVYCYPPPEVICVGIPEPDGVVDEMDIWVWYNWYPVYEYYRGEWPIWIDVNSDGQADGDDVAEVVNGMFECNGY